MAVMRKASTIDEENIHKESEQMVQLMKENEGLRELLQISRQYGGSLNSSGTDDGEVTQIENLKSKPEQVVNGSQGPGDKDEDDD